MKNFAFLSLGSNVGNRYRNLKSAITNINKNKFTNIVNTSNIYESEPMYNLNQNKFYNMVVKINTALNAYELLKLCKTIESAMGRKENNQRNMPRLIDIDIITFNNQVIETDNLIVPHPKMPERSFVLLPFNEIEPNYVLPNKKSLSHLLNVLKDSSKIIKLDKHIL